MSQSKTTADQPNSSPRPTPSELIEIALKLPQPLGFVHDRSTRLTLLEDAYQWWKNAHEVVDGSGQSKESQEYLEQAKALLESSYRNDALKDARALGDEVVRFDDHRLLAALGESVRKDDTPGEIANRIRNRMEYRYRKVVGEPFPYSANPGVPMSHALLLLVGDGWQQDRDKIRNALGISKISEKSCDS